jgi:hypothetical protein
VHEDLWDPKGDQACLEPKGHEEIQDPLDHQDLADKTPKDQIPKEKWLVSLMDHLAQTSYINTKTVQLDLWDHQDLQDHKDQKENLVMLDHQGQ